jgi:hypothetical protein
MMKKLIVILLAVAFMAASLYAAEAKKAAPAASKAAAASVVPATVTAAPVTMEAAPAPVVKESFLKRLWHKLFPKKSAAPVEAAGNTMAPAATTATAK